MDINEMFFHTAQEPMLLLQTIMGTLIGQQDFLD